ncbi:MAG: flagellar basal body rod protein FlgB [Candidatus Aquicultor sp.]|nr:flagellar basal body rod protein FlgB [Candidatus Aquicultor sp.]
MIGKLFSGDTFVALQKGMDATSLRQQVISENIANINTPGYKKRDVLFEGELKRALAKKYDSRMQQTDARHLPGGRSLAGVGARVDVLNATSMREDGNNVDVDEEMTNLAENNIRFNTMAQLIASRFTGLKNVINEGRR